MRVSAADNFPVKHSPAMHVIGVLCATGNFVRTIHAGNALANQGTLRGLGPCVFCFVAHDLRSFSVFGYLHHRRFNAGVGPAPAEVSTQTCLDLVGGCMRMLIEKSFRRHDKTGRAEAALLRVIIDEGLLYGVKFAGLAETFNGRNLPVLGVNSKNGAGINSFAIQMDGAGAAGSTIANALGAREFKLVAECIQQSDARFQSSTKLLAVDVQRDWNLSRPVFSYFICQRQRSGMADQRDSSGDAGNFQEVAT